MIVVDANVVVAFMLDSPLASIARAIRARDTAWIAPPLCKYETLNAFLQETKARKITLADAIRAAETFSRLITENTDGGAPSAILSVAHSTGLTAYDATYVVLARSLGVPLVTEDKQILRACPDIARTMMQFLTPPEPPKTVREKAAEYKVKRKKKQGVA